MFIFKSKRTYINSADIINFIDYNYTYSNLDIKYYKFLKHQPRVKIIKKKLIKNHNANIAAKLKYKKDVKYILFYETKKKIINNYSYDEELLIKFFKINSIGIKCNFKNNIGYMDLIVSMSKLWHLRKVDKKKKWIVVRIDLNKKLIDKINKNIHIKVMKVINKKYSVSEIIVDKITCGRIYYTSANIL